MTIRIAMFNHKGGVSKTTTTLHLAWMLASRGKRVLMVDADPQCNLTGLVLGYTGATEFESFYQAQTSANIKAGLTPAFESQPKSLQPVKCVEIARRKGLFLLPGHLGLSEYEVTLGIAQELSGTIQALQNLPGAIPYLLNATAEAVKADYAIIDMNPSLSSINQNILMTSHFFMIPCSPDFFSVLAIDSLSSVIPRWRAWATQAQTLKVFQDAAYPFPQVNPKFLGTVISRYRPRGGKATEDFQKWIDQINTAVETKLAPVLQKANLLVDIAKYKAAGVDTKSFGLGLIPDFNTLIAKSQKAQTPVFALSTKQMERGGVVLKKTLENRNTFKKLFENLADKIIALTS